MIDWPLQDNGWALSPAVDSHFDEIMTWFPDGESVNNWAGPNFQYPFSGETFRRDCRIDQMDSYMLLNSHGDCAAFGQTYIRDGRGHLARLVSNPAMRRQGAGRQLIQMITTALAKMHSFDEYSLFVFRDNVPAYRCYLSLGFVVVDYPNDAPMPDKCYFLTRKATRRTQ